MKHLIIYAHPREGSTNHQLQQAIKAASEEAGHQVTVRDLYALNFNPVLSLEDIQGQMAGKVAEDVSEEQRYIREANVITFIYPIWWTGMPAIMKGYIDRIMSYGFAYRYNNGVQQGLLKGKIAFIINTHGKSNEEYHAIGMDKALLLTSDTGVYTYCGLEVKAHLYFDRADKATPDMKATWIEQVRQLPGCISSGIPAASAPLPA